MTVVDPDGGAMFALIRTRLLKVTTPPEAAMVVVPATGAVPPGEEAELSVINAVDAGTVESFTTLLKASSTYTATPASGLPAGVAPTSNWAKASCVAAPGAIVKGPLVAVVSPVSAPGADTFAVNV
jgi:hypothetical protein